jgi:hypothetical protein
MGILQGVNAVVSCSLPTPCRRDTELKCLSWIVGAGNRLSRHRFDFFVSHEARKTKRGNDELSSPLCDYDRYTGPGPADALLGLARQLHWFSGDGTSPRNGKRKHAESAFGLTRCAGRRHRYTRQSRYLESVENSTRLVVSPAVAA